MKHAILAALVAAPLLATAQKLPQPSPKGSVEQVIGLTTVKVEYNRPSMKGRVIFGDLVPYGKVWRTGANQCTTIEFDGPVTIQGEPVKPGKYSLFTIPSEDTWVVILNRNTELWGAEDRKEEEDVLRLKAQRRKNGTPVETLTFSFDAIGQDKAELGLRWEAMHIPLLIEADATEQSLQNIKEALSKPDADYRAYHGSARFCLDRGIRQEDALAWAQRSVSMERKYWNTYTLALAYASNGKMKEAVESANESMKLAQEAKDDTYVKMCKARIDEWRPRVGTAAPSTTKPTK